LRECLESAIDGDWEETATRQVADDERIERVQLRVESPAVKRVQ
jgi:hypothetical protein